jgi:class 3 adenylate cyclase/tetratricopeptide (TPR) repeat protein
MIDREQLLRAIAAQEGLRGTIPDEVVDTAVAVLRAQLADVPPSSPVERRRQATVVFADVAGFTAMSEGVDAEVLAGLMNELWHAVDAVIGRYGGRVDKHIGDAVMGVWGAESAREDDPERAVLAALEVRDVFVEFIARHDLDVAVRVGVSTGPVLFGTVGTAGEVSVTGDAVNVASRIEHAAPHGHVLISHDTYRHVRGAFDVRPQDPIAVKGKSQPLRTYVVERAKPRAFRVPSRGVEGVETRMIGRDDEMAALQQAFVETVEQRRSRLVKVIGEPGAGKSRLLFELTDWLELHPELVYGLKGRSTPDTQTVPRGLLREVFAHRFEIFDDDTRMLVVAKLRTGLQPLTVREADVVGHWLGFHIADSAAVQNLAGSTEFGTVALTHLTNHLRLVLGNSPAVLLLEDVHWADGESLDAIEHLVDALYDAPLFVVAVARPSLFEARPQWASGPEGSSSITLGPLSDRDGRTLVREILQRVEAVPDDLVELIAERAGGNPFHAEELAKMLVDDGVIQVDPGDGGPWRVDVERLDRDAIPATLTGVMQARLDGLEPAERTMLQHASVIGRTFWDDTVAELLRDGLPIGPSDAEIDSWLAAVRDRELVQRRDRSTFSGCGEYKFKHALLRDATYETVLLRDRRRLHRAAADWLQRRAGERLTEHVGALAEHLFRAGDLERAAELLDEAATHARRTGALNSAVSFHERSLGFRQSIDADGGAAATGTRLDLGHLLILLSRHDDAVRLLTVAESDARRLGDDRLVARALAEMVLSASTRGSWADATGLLERARPMAEQVGGPTLGRVLHAEGLLLIRGPDPDLDAAQHVAERALAVWSGRGEPTDELNAINMMGFVAHAAGRPDETDRWFEEGLAFARRIGDTASEARILLNGAVSAHVVVREEHGDYAPVLDRYRTSLEHHRRLGLSPVAALTNLAQAEVEAGVLDEGTAHAREALQHAWRRHNPIDWTLCLVVFAQIAIRSGRRDEGLQLLGAVLAERRTPSLEREVEAVIAFHGIDEPTATEVMATADGVDLEAVIEDLLAAVP